VPESRSRTKATYTPPPAKSEKKSYGDNPRWLVPTMVGLFVVGLTWIVLYYTAGNSIPGMSSLGALGNVIIGFLFIVGGFILAMRWR
jgi:hypothetical protein